MSATGDPAEAGTTLIETLVAIAIVSLVALVGFPRLQQALRSLSQRQTVSVVAAQLRRVRAEALSSDRRLVFAINDDGRSYRVPGAVAGTPAGVELKSSGDRVIAFYGDGSSSGGLVWITAGRRSVPVSVASATGVVSVGAAR